MRIETPIPNSLPEPSRLRTEGGEARPRPRPSPTARDLLASTDVVQLSDAARDWLEGLAPSGVRNASNPLSAGGNESTIVPPSSDIETVDLQPTPAQLWEEARQSLLREPMEPDPSEAEGVGPLALSHEDEAVVDELRARDAEVRAHEAAHAAIGGGVPTYVYQTGPDGKRYAVGGEVVVSASGGSTAQGTIDRMKRLRAAALAPSSPSAQDMAVAAEATQREATARVRKNKMQTAEVMRESEERLGRGELRRAASAFEAQQPLAVVEKWPHAVAVA